MNPTDLEIIKNGIEKTIQDYENTLVYAIKNANNVEENVMRLQVLDAVSFVILNGLDAEREAHDHDHGNN